MQLEISYVHNMKSRNYLEDTKILIIEDDCDSQLLLSRIFTSAGAEVFIAENGHVGIKKFVDHAPDLIMLDIMMPDIDGYEVCARIREKSSVPIILLTALNQEEDIIKGLDVGANDYLSKPFSQALLLSHAQAVLRSSLHFHVREADDMDFSDGYLTMSLELRKVWIEGTPVQITPREFDLLNYLFRNTGRIMTFDQILDHVWGWEYRGSTQYVHMIVSNLRRKIERDVRNPTYLVNEYGVGYSFNIEK